MEPTERTTVRRQPERGAYDRATVHAVLDAALLCHLGIVADGHPVVIPTLYGRLDDVVYVHGSPASRLLRTMKKGADVCLTATAVDGIVLARSAFHHSMNYRSVVLFGHARLVTDLDEKLAALRAISDHVIADRWTDARPPNDKELRAVHVLALPIEEASAKIRTGPPIDEDEDYDLPVWAGVLPLQTVVGPPIPDPRLRSDLEPPPYLTSPSLSRQ